MKNLNNKSNTLNKSKSDGPTTRRGIERIFKIMGFLQNGNIEGEPVNCTNLTHVLEVNRATVMRDLNFLRDTLRVEFEWCSSEKEYILTGDYKSFPCMEINDVDRLLFEYIERTLLGVGDTELGSAMQFRFKRLMGIFTGKNPKTSVQASFAGKGAVSELKVYNLTQRAIEAKDTLKVTCKLSGSAETSAKWLKPEKILFEASQWWLEAVEVETKDVYQIPFESVVQIEVIKANEKSPAGVATNGVTRQPYWAHASQKAA